MNPTLVDHDLAVRELFAIYAARLGEQWTAMAAWFLVAVVVGLAWNVWLARRGQKAPLAFERWLSRAFVVVIIAVGLRRVYERAAIYDDAFISLRYVENLVAGHGLVWNVGERVEGYTNFLWTMLIALFRVLTPLESPLIVLVLCASAYVANLLVVHRLSLAIAPPSVPGALRFPLAVALLAVQQTFVDYGTSGLETGFASLLVNLGALALVQEPTRRSAFFAGLSFILATLTRPDHALFYVVGAAVVFGAWSAPVVAAARERAGLEAMFRAGLAPMLLYAAPFALFLAHLNFRLFYYDEFFPNTYYTKAAGRTYYEQGLVYATEFHLGSHAWVVILALLVVLPMVWPKDGPARRFVAFSLPAIFLYELYVLRLGGDFMVGRFYLSLIPLLLLLAELGVRRLACRRSTSEGARPWSAVAGALVFAGLCASTAQGVRLIAPQKVQYHLADETTHYRVASYFPIVIDHGNYQIGQLLGALNARGIRPIVSTGTIGLIGFYSKLEIVDRFGLTDAFVARQPLPAQRSRPGHEKEAPLDYLRARGVHFVTRARYASTFLEAGQLRFGNAETPYLALRYERELMQKIRESGLDIRVGNLEAFLDAWITRLPELPPERVRAEYEFLEQLYFAHNDDSYRRRAYQLYLQWVDEGHDPKALESSERWAPYRRRAASSD